MKVLKITLVATISMVIVYKAYSEQKKETMSDIVIANIEALAQNENIVGRYTKTTGKCSGPLYYKTWVSCKKGGNESCMPSDC